MGFLSIPLELNKVPAVHDAAALPLVLSTEGKANKVPASAKTKAHEKLLFLQRVVEYAREHGVSEEAASGAVALHATDFPILSKAGQNGSSALTIFNFRNWMRQTGRRKDGMPDANNFNALIDSYYGREVRRPGDDAFWLLFFKKALNPQAMKAPAVWRSTVSICKAHGITDCPSFAQVQYFIKHHFPKAVWEAARRGENWASDRLYAYTKRDWTAIQPGYCWVGDHHKLDCYVQITDPETGKCKVVRPWITAWMDIRSLYFVGIELSAEPPNTVSILRALAMGYSVNNWRGPQMLYSDNGADFKRKGFATPVEIGGVEHSICNSLGIVTTFSQPYNGRAKPIERIFKEIADNFVREQKSYLGNTPDARPAEASYYEKCPEDAPTLEEVQAGLCDYIFNVYHQTPQNGRILGLDENGQPRTPEEVWAERGEFGIQWTPQVLKAAMLFPLPQTRQVRQGGWLQILRKDYREINKGQRLFAQWERDVLIKQDLFLGGYAAFTLKGEPITVLEEVPGVRALGAAYDDEESAKLAAEIAHARRQKAWVRNVVRSSTGLPVLVCSDDAAKLMEPGAKLELTGEKMSVKGTTHKYQNYRVIVPGETQETEVIHVQSLPQLPEPETQKQPESEDSRQILEFAERLKQIKRQQTQQD